MIHKIKILSLGFALTFLGISAVQAQKMGHLNSGNLLELLPETKKAGEDLEAFQKGLMKAYQVKVKAFEKEVQDFYNPKRRENQTPIQVQDEQNRLTQKEQDLLKERKEIDQQVFDKRQELLGPLLKRVDEAIQAVAKEQNFQMIFDSSVFNAVLFKDEAHDITEAVKAKLGIKEKE
ncbi:MAG: OmpH family outer membrane protein [Bacteroidota bacterium]